MSIYQKYLDELSAKPAESAVTTPNWLIRIAQSSESSSGSSSENGKAITSSKIPNFLDYCYLYDFKLDMEREIQKAATEQVKPDGGLTAGTLKIVIASSFLNADFNNIFHENNCLDITMSRVQSLQSESPILVETYSFLKSYTTKLLVHSDLIAASFRYASFSRTTTSTNSEGGNEGNVAASYNFVSSSKKTS